MPWRTIDGQEVAPRGSVELEVLLKGVFEKQRFLYIVLNRRSVTIDWTVRENARAQIRVIVKRILRKYGYPPDKQEKATQTVLEQAEVLCKEWVTG